MAEFGGVYSARRVLVTGHTGFKGSWLTVWLNHLGADITGVALPPQGKKNHWDLLALQVVDKRLDIRDEFAVKKAFADSAPEIVFHLAAQPLVRRSYMAPLETWETNVIGTANVLEACRHTPSVKAVVCVTTDKCYEDQNWVWGYRESDRLGGHDPYSASKASAELVASSYRSAYFTDQCSVLLATARAGNVIGGGDWSEDRLIPDLVRAITENKSLEIRMPQAVRPWQHVLDSLSGYLCLGEALLSGQREAAEAWNFGPGLDGNGKVVDVLNLLKAHWSHLQWYCSVRAPLHETSILRLDNTKSRTRLHWEPVWSLAEALRHTAEWYSTLLELGEVITKAQIRKYCDDARAAGVKWAYD